MASNLDFYRGKNVLVTQVILALRGFGFVSCWKCWGLMLQAMHCPHLRRKAKRFFCSQALKLV